MARKKEVMTLCAVCYRQFKDIPNRKIVPTKNRKLEPCTYCNVRNGYEYTIITKGK